VRRVIGLITRTKLLIQSSLWCIKTGSGEGLIAANNLAAEDASLAWLDMQRGW